MIEKHFVTFYSPGTLVSEDTTKPIERWDLELAQKMAGEITERHGAVPYGFRFTTRSRGDADLDSSVSARSGMYYIGCKIETLAEIEARNDPRDEILLRNMRRNNWPAIVTSTRGWKWSQPLRDGDVVL